MNSQLTVRLPDELKNEIAKIANRYRLKRSDVIRMALERFIEEFYSKEDIRPYDRVKDLIGSISSGVEDLGEAHRKYLLRKFRKNA